jgi:D-alanyl-D-alanine-carboxypeptidase/D-alanyl-D-alanine-endopeptidase
MTNRVDRPGNSYLGASRCFEQHAPEDTQNPWADYPAEKMYEFLNGYVLERDIGSRYQYSNIGAGLPGNALSLRAHAGYEALVREKIPEPLNMKNTGIALSNSMKARLGSWPQCNAGAG